MTKPTRRKKASPPAEVKYVLDLYLSPKHICAYDRPTKGCSKCG